MKKKICPVTYESIADDQKYSIQGLHKLSPQLAELLDLPFSAEEQRQEAALRAQKISVQGVQPKLSAKLRVSRGKFEVVDMGGKYILKPQNDLYKELPENEDLTMRLAAMVGIEVPLHGLVYSKDGSMTFFIKRFDRYSYNAKLAVEDFAQLSDSTRDTRYSFTMERLVFFN